MQIQKRSLNWLPKESAWKAAEIQREKRKAAHQTFLDQQTTLADTFQSGRDNLTMGMAEISGKVFAARVQAEGQAKAAAADATTQSIDLGALTSDGTDSATDTETSVDKTA